MKDQTKSQKRYQQCVMELVAPRIFLQDQVLYFSDLSLAPAHSVPLRETPILYVHESISTLAVAISTRCQLLSR